MSVAVKVCGLTDASTLATAIGGGAAFVGFVFFPASPRVLTPSRAASLAAAVPPAAKRIGVVVDADDATLEAILAAVELDMLQCHGSETPARVAEIRERFRRPVIKAIAVADDEDVLSAGDYQEAADMLLFDGRPPPAASRPGGNASTFEWSLLRARQWRLPWILAGGLNIDNLASAVAQSGARIIDVSSGLELTPGRKDPARITAFLELARSL
jgi:phosphoribosylanthranilate isomerase